MIRIGTKFNDAAKDRRGSGMGEWTKERKCLLAWFIYLLKETRCSKINIIYGLVASNARQSRRHNKMFACAAYEPIACKCLCDVFFVIDNGRYKYVLYVLFHMPSNPFACHRARVHSLTSFAKISISMLSTDSHAMIHTHSCIHIPQFWTIKEFLSSFRSPSWLKTEQ